MNQTEILKNRHHTQSSSIEKHQLTEASNQNSTLTIVRGAGYEATRVQTPKIQLSKNGSNSKIIRVSSSKGINVYSVRPSSTEKQVKQFTANTNGSLGGSSETTIKIDESGLMGQMREEMKRMALRYEDKMNKELSFQHNYLTVEIDRLKQLLAQNQGKLARQEHELQELLHRVETVQRKIEAKTTNMFRQLHEFKRFYDQCYTYTIRRITDTESTLKQVAKYVEQQTSTTSHIETWKYIEYANNLVKNIVVQCSAHSSSLKYYVDQELYDLEIGLGSFTNRYEEIDAIVHEMKCVRYGNEGLRDCVREMGRYQQVSPRKEPSSKEIIMEYYQPKFKQLIKRINNSTIQIDLLKTLLTSQKQQNTAIQTQKLQSLTQTITSLQASLQQAHTQYTTQLAQKQQQLNRSNPRILELESQLHAFYEHEAKMLKEISELKLKVSYYQTKCEKGSAREYGIQSTMAEAFAETLVKEKSKKWMEQKEALQAQIKNLEQKIKVLDNQNYLLAQKLSKSSQKLEEHSKLEAQLKFATKLIHEHQQSQQKYEKQTQQHHSQLSTHKKQQEKILAFLEQQKTRSKALADKLETLLKEKNAVREDDELYFAELEQEVESCYQRIERLESVNEELVGKNKELVQKNLTLEADLHDYAQTFQKQSITFRTALQSLQKEKDFLGAENKKMSEQNRSLKLDIQNSRTAQSFYQNNSNLSLQLRKTVSTELNRASPPLSSTSGSKQLFRKTFSTGTGTKQRTEKTAQLKNVLQKLKYELPVVCEIDATGYLKDQRTGCYFVDENENYFQLDQNELANAVKLGLILL